MKFEDSLWYLGACLVNGCYLILKTMNFGGNCACNVDRCDVMLTPINLLCIIAIKILLVLT